MDIKQEPPSPNGDRAASVFEVLKARSDFLRAAKGRSKGVAGFHLQAYDRKDGAAPRVGFTCSKKVGNAVARNRAKRRLREIARLEIGEHGLSGWDYVLIGRRDVTASLPFDELRAGLRHALAAVH